MGVRMIVCRCTAVVGISKHKHGREDIQVVEIGFCICAASEA